MEFPELVILRDGSTQLWVPGPTHQTRSDGSSSLMVSQAYGSDADLEEGHVLVDEFGVRWALTHDLSEGFHFSGIVLEQEEYSDRKTE